SRSPYALFDVGHTNNAAHKAWFRLRFGPTGCAARDYHRTVELFQLSRASTPRSMRRISQAGALRWADMARVDGAEVGGREIARFAFADQFKSLVRDAAVRRSLLLRCRQLSAERANITRSTFSTS